MNPHILFVDDEAPIRELLSVCFRIHGVPVTTATTGRDARLLAANATFDLTILDLHLPDESGLDLLRFFKTEFPRMPVIIFTGMGSDKELVAQARAGGAAGFLDKTQSLYVLLAEVRRHLPGHPQLNHPMPTILAPAFHHRRKLKGANGSKLKA
jgi:DNA-binding response OmpR family regulator